MESRAAKYSTNLTGKKKGSVFIHRSDYFIMRKITFWMQMFRENNGNHNEHEY
jgi:hypothetical protein